jgi:NADH-quinone oxidoreductase subunit H
MVFLAALLKFAVIVLGFVMVLATLLTLLERKQSALMQNRTGPNRAFIFGKNPLSAFVGQLIADPVKVLLKETFDPPHANTWIHRLAPGLAFIPALLMWVVIPFGPGPVPGAEGGHFFLMANLDAGVLVVFAVASLSVYGSTLGAWASKSAFSMLGGLRTAAQMVSYEVTLGLNLVGIFMIYGSLNLNDIIWAQAGWNAATGLQDAYFLGFIPKWGIITQPFAFLFFITASIAETKRAPFDLPEAESELAAGYFTEYSSMGFAVFSLGEFIGIIVVAALGAAMFLGGWHIPGLPIELVDGQPLIASVATWLSVGAFLVKVVFLVLLQMTIRWTLPRFRYDQLMKLGWVYLLPLSLANVAITAFVLFLTR